jgi:GxxExxY protein
LLKLLCRTDNTDGGTDDTDEKKGLDTESDGVAIRICGVRLMTMPERDPLTGLIIGAAIEVRKRVGCGLLESAYHAFLCFELEKLKLTFKSQPTLPVIYDGHRVELAYRPDLIVNDRVIIELKTVTAFSPVHEAQILTYLRLSGIRIGLLLNFHAVPFKSGIKRFII